MGPNDEVRRAAPDFIALHQEGIASGMPGYYARLARDGLEGMPNVGHYWRELGLKPGDPLLYIEGSQAAAVTIHPDSENKNFLLIVTVEAVFKRGEDGKLHFTDQGWLGEHLGKAVGVLGTSCFIVPGFAPEDRAAREASTFVPLPPREIDPGERGSGLEQAA